MDRLKNHEISLGRLSKELEIPAKNIRRWRDEGLERKKGPGKKIKDPEMERELKNWLDERERSNNPAKKSEIQDKAKELSRDPKFHASKGWLQKFLERTRRDSSADQEK